MVEGKTVDHEIPPADADGVKCVKCNEFYKINNESDYCSSCEKYDYILSVDTIKQNMDDVSKHIMSKSDSRYDHELFKKICGKLFLHNKTDCVKIAKLLFPSVERERDEFNNIIFAESADYLFTQFQEKGMPFDYTLQHFVYCRVIDAWNITGGGVAECYYGMELTTEKRFRIFVDPMGTMQDKTIFIFSNLINNIRRAKETT
jgi:hypothetical protein